MIDYLDFKEMQLKLNDIQKTSYKCKCGHTVVITYQVDKALCNYCNNLVFKDKRSEFEYRLKENLFRERRKLNEEHN